MVPHTLEQTEQIRQIKDIYRDYKLDAIPNDTINKIAAFHIEREDKRLYEWMDAVEVELKEYNENVEYDGHTVKIFIHKLNNLRNLINNIESICNKMKNEVDSGKQPAKIFPYALECLFENESPHYDIKIVSYFREGNYALVKTRISIGKYSGRKHRTTYKDVEHEFVIEKWFRNNEPMFKTKNKAFFEQLKSLKKAKEAPKVDKIDIRFSSKQVYTASVLAPEIFIKQDHTLGIPVIEVREQHKFTKSIVLEACIKGHVTYNDGKYAQIDFYKDEFYQDDTVKNEKIGKRSGLGSRYFAINQFGGLQEIDQLPVSIKLKIPEEPEQPVMEVVPLDISDIYIPISEDERETLPFKYTYFNVILENESHRARIYKIVNKMTEDVFMQYMAKYDDCWVNTNSSNPRVIELLEALDFCDTLTKDWTEIEA